MVQGQATKVTATNIILIPKITTTTTIIECEMEDQLNEADESAESTQHVNLTQNCDAQ